MHLTLKNDATKPAAQNLVQQAGALRRLHRVLQPRAPAPASDSNRPIGFAKAVVQHVAKFGSGSRGRRNSPKRSGRASPTVRHSIDPTKGCLTRDGMLA